MKCVNENTSKMLAILYKIPRKGPSRTISNISDNMYVDMSLDVITNDIIPVNEQQINCRTLKVDNDGRFIFTDILS